MIASTRQVAGAVFLALLARGGLGAQEAGLPVTHSLDAGLAFVHFPEQDFWLPGPWLRITDERKTGEWRTGLSATSIVAPGAGAVSGDGSAWWVHALTSRTTLELGGEGSALASSGQGSASGIVAGGRLARAFGDGGVWLRTAGHVGWREAGALTGHGVELGSWWRSPGVTLTATVAREWAQAQLFAGSGRSTVLGVVPVRYTEGALGLTTQSEAGSVTLTAGARRDPDAAQHVEALWSASVLRWVSTNSAIIASVSRTPDDFIHGADAAQSVTFGVRFAARDGGRVTMAAATRSTIHIAGEPGGATLSVHSPGARTIELMADFTGWEPVTLHASSGDFTLDSPPPSGSHRILVRVDGGEWHPPANAPTVGDDFGGRVGLVLVP